MKRIAHIAAALMAIILLASCSAGKVVYEKQDNKLSSTGKSWTVLVYMCGGNDETENSTASDKIESMMSVDYPENVNVVIQTGGSSQWHIKGIYSDYVQRFEVGKGTMYLADQAIAANMGDYKTLADFLTWGTTNYKSDNYMLVLSGNGGGCTYGMAYDELFDNDCLTLEEISYAMSVAGKNFDVVGMDASLMGSLETASAISTYADYLVAPQDMQNTDAWDYAGFLKYMCENPSGDTGNIGKAVCDSYYNKSVKNDTYKYAAMSVVDLAKISTLNQAFDGMAGDMLVATDLLDNYINLSDALSKVYVYGGATEDEGYSNLVDLGDMAVKCGEQTGNTADMLIEALNDAVIYRVCGENQKSSTGLGVFYPLDRDNDHLQNYMDISTSSKYKEFLRKICINCTVEDKLTNTADYTSSWAWTSYNDDMSWLEYLTVLDGNSYELDISGNMSLFKDVAINVYKEDSESGKYVFVGKYTDIEKNWEGGIFKDNFKGNLMEIAGKSMTMRLARSYDDYDLYSIPVILNGERSNIRVRHNRNDEDYEIIGAWSGVDENGMVKSIMSEIGVFDRITPILSVYDEEHKKKEYVIGSLGLKLWGGVDNKSIDDGNYILEYEMTDVYGMKRRGTPVKLVKKSGEFSFESE